MALDQEKCRGEGSCRFLFDKWGRVRDYVDSLERLLEETSFSKR
jgi:hypothetical protein